MWKALESRKNRKNTCFLCKTAPSALRSFQNEALEGQNLTCLTQTSPHAPQIHSKTCLKHFSHQTCMWKALESRKNRKKTCFLCKTALSALRSSQNEALEGQNLTFLTQTSPHAPQIHSKTCLKHFSHQTCMWKALERRVFCAKLH